MLRIGGVWIQVPDVGQTTGFWQRALASPAFSANYKLGSQAKDSSSFYATDGTDPRGFPVCVIC